MVMLVIEQNKTRYLNNNVAIKRKKNQKQTKKENTNNNSLAVLIFPQHLTSLI